MTRLQAWQQSAPATESPKTVSAPSPDQAAKPAEAGPAVDAAKVTGSTFQSQYFKFTYELPKGWKALDDAVRVSANQMLAQADQDGGAGRPEVSAKTRTKAPVKKNPALASGISAAPESYSLMVASSNGVDSLASPVLPRINVWARRRVPPLDSAADHAQFLLTHKRTQVLASPRDVTLDGHSFVRVDVITPTGEYESQFLAVMGDYLVGFDFRAESQREMTEMTDTMKTIKFQ